MYDGSENHCISTNGPGRLDTSTACIEIWAQRLTISSTTEPFTLLEVHAYVGSEILPKKKGVYTVAPRKYPKSADGLPAGTTTYKLVFDGKTGDQYVIAHAVVAGFQVNSTATVAARHIAPSSRGRRLERGEDNAVTGALRTGSRREAANGHRPSGAAPIDMVRGSVAGTVVVDTTLQARGLTRLYRTGEVVVHALRGVDLDLFRGELVVLLGPSGSGKSTLLNILGGLDLPTAGSVLFRGRDLAGADERTLTKYRRDHVGFVFQFYNLVPSLTARENVALVTEISANPMDPGEALDLVGLHERIDHFPAQLSGGEQQRVAIARAIAKNPEILLCDEPTGALDSETGILVLEAIARVNRELGATTAVITHNSVVSGMADRVVELADGRVVETRVNTTRLAPREMAW